MNKRLTAVFMGLCVGLSVVALPVVYAQEAEPVKTEAAPHKGHIKKAKKLRGAKHHHHHKHAMKAEKMDKTDSGAEPKTKD